MTKAQQQRGRFITLEGGEGAGKSTCLPIVAQWLRERGHDVVLTREPGGTQDGELLRTLLMEGDWPGISELLLMFAARAAHLQQRILPALDAGSWVVCDRFTDSSYAYQGAARGLGDDCVATLENLVQGEFRPDLTLIFDIEPQQGLARTRDRADNNRFDAEALSFHETVREALLAQARKAPARYSIINAGATPEQVQASLIQELETQWPPNP